MIRILWAASVRIRYYLRPYMPTNILLDLIRTGCGLKRHIRAMLLAAPYLLAASICAKLIAEGGPGWLNLFVLLFIWNAMKFIAVGPVSIVLLVRLRVRIGEARRSEPRRPAAL